MGVRAAELPVELELGTVGPAERLSGARVVPFTVRVRLDRVLFEEREDSVEATMELVFSSATADGGTSEPQAIRVPIRVDRSKWQNGVRGTWTYAGEFRVEKGDYRFVVTVRDPGSGRIGSAEVSARID